MQPEQILGVVVSLIILSTGTFAYFTTISTTTEVATEQGIYSDLINQSVSDPTSDQTIYVGEGLENDQIGTIRYFNGTAWNNVAGAFISYSSNTGILTVASGGL